MRTLSIIAVTAGFAGAAVLAGALVAAGNGASLTLPARSTTAAPGSNASRGTNSAARPSAPADAAPAPSVTAPGHTSPADARANPNSASADPSAAAGAPEAAWRAAREPATYAPVTLPEVDAPSGRSATYAPGGGGGTGSGAIAAPVTPPSGATASAAPAGGGTVASPAGALIATGTPLTAGTTSSPPGATTGGGTNTAGDAARDGADGSSKSGSGKDTTGGSGKDATGGKDQTGKDKPGGTKPAPGGPPRIRIAVSGTPSAGAQVAVRIMFDNARNVASVPFHVVFDPAVLQFTRATQGGLLGADGQQATLMAAVTADGNRLVVGDARLGPVPGISGSGELCTLWFTAVGPGVSPLAFDQASVWSAGGGTADVPFESGSVVVAGP